MGRRYLAMGKRGTMRCAVLTNYQAGGDAPAPRRCERWGERVLYLLFLVAVCEGTQLISTTVGRWPWPIGMRRPMRRCHDICQHGVFDLDHAVARCAATPECNFFALSTGTWRLPSNIGACYLMLVADCFCSCWLGGRM